MRRVAESQEAGKEIFPRSQLLSYATASQKKSSTQLLLYPKGEQGWSDSKFYLFYFLFADLVHYALSHRDISTEVSQIFALLQLKQEVDTRCRYIVLSFLHTAF